MSRITFLSPRLPKPVVLDVNKTPKTMPTEPTKTLGPPPPNK